MAQRTKSKRSGLVVLLLLAIAGVLAVKTGWAGFGCSSGGVNGLLGATPAPPGCTCAARLMAAKPTATASRKCKEKRIPLVLFSGA